MDRDLHDRALPPRPSSYPPYERREDDPGHFSTPPMTPSRTAAPGPIAMPSPILIHRQELSQSPPGSPNTSQPEQTSPVITPIIVSPPQEETSPVAGPSRRPTTRTPSAETPGEEYGPPQPLTQERLLQRATSAGHGARWDGNVHVTGNEYGNGNGGSSVNGNGSVNGHANVTHPPPTHPVRALSFDGSRYHDRHVRTPMQRDIRPMTAPSMGSAEGRRSRRSVIDHVVPQGNLAQDVEQKRVSMVTSIANASIVTVADRLGPTLDNAEEELAKARRQSRLTGYALNVCIGLQVLLGALTTGIAASTRGNQTGIAVAILGGLSTLAASYLARSRGSGEPERSIVRCKDLEHFIRDCKGFKLDKGFLTGPQYDREVNFFRMRFEEILGNNKEQNVNGNGAVVTKNYTVNENDTTLGGLPGLSYAYNDRSGKQSFSNDKIPIVMPQAYNAIPSDVQALGRMAANPVQTFDTMAAVPMQALSGMVAAPMQAFDRMAAVPGQAFDRAAAAESQVFDRMAAVPEHAYERVADAPARLERMASAPVQAFERAALAPAQAFERAATAPAEAFERMAAAPAQTLERMTMQPPAHPHRGHSHTHSYGPGRTGQ